MASGTMCGYLDCLSYFHRMAIILATACRCWNGNSRGHDWYLLIDDLSGNVTYRLLCLRLTNIGELDGRTRGPLFDIRRFSFHPPTVYLVPMIRRV